MREVKFCKPIVPDFLKVQELLSDSMYSGHLSNFGLLYHKAVSRLSRMLWLGPEKDIVLTSSGHTALMTAYAALGVKKLVVPDYTFTSTEQAAKLQGIETIVVDVDIDTGCLTTEILSSINEDYDAVVVVCPLSTIPDLKKLHDYCKENNKKLIIDGAATFGSKTSIYSLGDAYCFSFHATKTLPVGECGAVVLNKDKCDLAKSYITFGLNAEKKVELVGINAKVSEYTCAILLSLLDTVWESIGHRLDITYLYKRELGEFVLPSNDTKTVYTSLPIYVKDVSQDIIHKLAENNIQTIKYYQPLVGLPNTLELFNSNICLPTHQEVTEDDVNRIIKIIRECIFRSK